VIRRAGSLNPALSLAVFTLVTLLWSSGAAPGDDVALILWSCRRATGAARDKHAVGLPSHVALESQRMISRLLLPSAVRLATYSLVR
jgi:hypothetical protein